MNETSTLLTLQTWMSAAFPTGAFTCSHGIEQAIADGRISNASECLDWISGIMKYGSGWNDAVIISEAYAALGGDDRLKFSAQGDNAHWLESRSALYTLNELALALCTGSERLRETTQLGHAFSKAVAATSAPECCVASWLDGDISLPVSIGASGALAAIPLDQLLPASLQATSSNLVWIATRLIPLGQTQALQMIASLQSLITELGKKARHSTLDDLGTCTLLADIASIEHEQLHSRICIT